MNPSVDELCDGIDNNCNGQIDEEGAIGQTMVYPDTDNDGYGDESGGILSCTQPAGYISIGGDCDDSNPSTFIGALEICDGIDNDCDGEIDETLDLIQPPCSNVGVCSGGGVSQCIDGMWTECDFSGIPAWQPSEDSCDGLDNDCDGVTDEGCPLP